MNEESIFSAALSRDPTDRPAFLDAACAGQPELRERIEALLNAHTASGDFLARPELMPSMAATGDFAPAPESGTTIAGKYVLEERIGEGGMGEVWVARQTAPVRRRVAVKLIRPGMDSRTVLARFEQERQALALMDHPNIAKVLDGGLTDDRRPFFVMELVNGLPLTRFCDEARLTPKDRLEVFVPICHAVQHAHQKGIVHRDLKPSNILVTVIDGKPVPKVIDFGVAKATAGGLFDDSMPTQFGAVVGTLEYMAPEQAGFSGVDVDTRADIYSLGVLLYELLTGLRPFDAVRLKQAAFAEMVRIIREDEPSKPSTRLSTDAALPSLAATRQTEPKRLMAMLRGELDWVVMKCLEKQRDRRYETANGLARDIARYLADEPVEARPPSPGYRLRKFVRRNRGQVGAAVAVVVALILGMAVALWQAREATIARHEALAALDDTEVARRAEVAERERAEANQKTAVAERDRARLQESITHATLSFLTDDLLLQADVRAQAKARRESADRFEIKPNPTVRDLLERAEAQLAPSRIEKKFPGQPFLQAQILRTVGDAYFGIGEFERAIRLYERARDAQLTVLASPPAGRPLGVDYRADLLVTLDSLGSAYEDAGRVDDAIAVLEKARAESERQLGADHLHTLGITHNLADAYREAGRLPDARKLMEKLRVVCLEKFGPEDHRTLMTEHNLARLYQDSGAAKAAVALFREVGDIQVRVLGPEDPDTLRTRAAQAVVQADAGEPGAAIDLLAKVVETELRLRPDHPNTLADMVLLGDIYQGASRPTESFAILERAVAGYERLGRLETPRGLTAASNLAQAAWVLKKFDCSIPAYEAIVKRGTKVRGPEHFDTLVAKANLGVNYRDANRLNEAITQLEAVRAQVVRDPALEWVTGELLTAYIKSGRKDGVQGIVKTEIEKARQMLPAGDPRRV